MSESISLSIYDAHDTSPATQQVIEVSIALLDHPDVLPIEQVPDFPDSRINIGAKRVYWIAKTALNNEGHLAAIATARIELKESSLFIHELGVHPDFRRQGIAERELMPEITRFARDNSCDSIRLYAVSEPAQALYQKLGFTARGDRYELELTDESNSSH